MRTTLIALLAAAAAGSIQALPPPITDDRPHAARDIGRDRAALVLKLQSLASDGSQLLDRQAELRGKEGATYAEELRKLSRRVSDWHLEYRRAKLELAQFIAEEQTQRPEATKETLKEKAVGEAHRRFGKNFDQLAEELEPAFPKPKPKSDLVLETEKLQKEQASKDKASQRAKPQ